MTGRLAGKVAFITGAARGQGRAHAVRMAEEGADVIAVDIAGKLPSCVPYPPATQEDLAETVRLVEEKNRRILASAVDIRDFDGLRRAVDEGVAELGRLDIIVANAGIAAPQAWNDITPESFRDVMDVNALGTWNTVMAGRTGSCLSYPTGLPSRKRSPTPCAGWPATNRATSPRPRSG